MNYKLFSILIFLLCCFTMRAQYIDSTNYQLSLNFKPTTNYLIYAKAPSMHQVFNEKRLPMFCRFEHKLDKKSALLLRFRLGSLDYVNTLESK